MIKLKSISLFILLFVFLLPSCIEKQTPTPNANGEAIIMSLDIDYNGSIFNTQISGKTITLDRLLPYGTLTVFLKSITLGENCTSNFKDGNRLILTDNVPNEIIVTNTISKKTTTYQVQLNKRNYSSVVDKYGLLQTSGNKIVDKNKNPVSLAGNSFYWSNNGWGGENLNDAQLLEIAKHQFTATKMKAHTVAKHFQQSPSPCEKVDYKIFTPQSLF